MKNVRLAICKPDHLGDFILALPSLRQIQRTGAALTLFVASSNFALADYYIPDAEKIALDLPYLQGGDSPKAWSQAHQQLGRLRSFDLTLFLRRDAFLEPRRFAQWTNSAFFIEDRNDVHQTRLEHAVVSKLVGSYDIDATFFRGESRRFADRPKRVAFAIGAGFPHKKWSPLLWTELGQMLQSSGIDVRVLAGPAEAEEAAIIARAIGARPQSSVHVGGSDFLALEQWIDDCDVVIAADGGSAHLCSLRKPVLSVFGPSPIARFAPIGAHNRAVTRSLACSPCAGFDTRLLNACLSRECLYGLRARSVFDALFLPSRQPGETVALEGPDRAEVRFGPSSAPMAT